MGVRRALTSPQLPHPASQPPSALSFLPPSVGLVEGQVLGLTAKAGLIPGLRPGLGAVCCVTLRKSLPLSGLSSSIYKKAKASEPRMAYTDFSLAI